MNIAKMVVMHDISNSNDAKSGKKTLRKITFAQALRDKYVDQEEFDNKLVLPKDTSISTEVTFVGFGKVSSVQKQLDKLVSIDLSAKQIELAGNLKDFEGSLDRVKVMNLADNSLSWHEVVSIILYLPQLRELILTKNQLFFDEFTCNFLSPTLKRLSSLTLGRIFLDWDSFIRILSHLWSCVEQLDLWDNHLNVENMKLTCSTEFEPFIRQIRALKLSQNYFPNLNWINYIGPIENLRELDLSNCQLQIIDIDIANQLKNLEFLNISYNNLDSWKSISNLHMLKNLSTLICLENPIFISEKFAKSITIGHLSRIKVLNREEITKGMRRDSEILYIRKTFPEYQSFTNGENCDFKSLHPRYEELANLYGLPEDLIKRQVIDKYITVDLCLNDKKITKKLPCDMRVANVQMLCKRLFKLGPSRTIQIICCRSNPSDSGLSYALDKDGQTLHFFSVKNGHKLLIKELDQ